MQSWNFSTVIHWFLLAVQAWESSARENHLSWITLLFIRSHVLLFYSLFKWLGFSSDTGWWCSVPCCTSFVHLPICSLTWMISLEEQLKKRGRRFNTSVHSPDTKGCFVLGSASALVSICCHPQQLLVIECMFVDYYYFFKLEWNLYRVKSSLGCSFYLVFPVLSYGSDGLC